ncbi:MAG: glycosyltransferase family 2 protein [Omnitrophica WOR_2 bacterium]
MSKLSVVIITLNEEKNIERCLRSIEGLSDDVIIVDSGSTDLTESICRSFGAHFYLHDWLGYAETKNFANSLAKYSLILSLDADEALSEELYKSIVEVLNNQKASAYSMNRLTNYCGKWIKHCGWYPDKKIRLFTFNDGFWSGALIHEAIKLKNGSPVIHLKGDILHYSYHTISDHVSQANKFSDLTAQQALIKGKQSTLLHVIFSPLVKFIRDYFIKGGFIDGYYGFIVCYISAFATFMKYAKLRQLNQQKKRSALNKSTNN